MRERARVLYQLSGPINGLYSIYTEQVEQVESTRLDPGVVPWARDHHTQFHKSLFEGIYL